MCQKKLQNRPSFPRLVSCHIQEKPCEIELLELYLQSYSKKC